MAEGPVTAQKTWDRVVNVWFADVLLVSFYTLVCLAVLQLSVNRLTGALLLPLLLFVPGYSIVVALYPERMTSTTGLDMFEVAALAFGVSFSILPLVAFGIAVSGYVVSAISLVAVLSVLTLGSLAVGVVRRRRLPRAERFRFPLDYWYQRLSSTVAERSSRPVVAMRVLLAVAMVLAVVTLGGAVLFPGSGESFSSLSVMTTTDDGSYVMGEYPTNLTEGQPVSYTVAVSNSEAERTRYTLLIQLQRVRESGQTVAVTERTQIERHELTLQQGETVHTNVTITPDTTGEDMRITYLLYRGQPPANPTGESAYRQTHLDVEIASGESE